MITNTESEKDGAFLDGAKSKAYCDNLAGVPQSLNFAGYDDEEQLRDLQAKSKQLNDKLYASRPVPLEVVERHNQVTRKLAEEALTLVLKTQSRLKGELEAVMKDLERSFSTGLKTSGAVRAICEESIRLLIGASVLADGSLYRRQQDRIDQIGVTAARLRGNTHRPKFLQDYIDGKSSKDAVSAWKSFA